MADDRDLRPTPPPDSFTPDAIREYVAALPRAARGRLLREAQRWGEENADAIRYAPRRLALSIAAVLGGCALIVTSCVLVGVLGPWAFIVGFPVAAYLIGRGIRHARGQVLPLYLEATATHGRLPACPGCAYDLRGSEAPRCPECGCPVIIAVTPTDSDESVSSGIADPRLDDLPSTPVGASATSGPSKHTAYRRLTVTPRGLSLVPSLYPVYLGLVLLAVYAGVAFVLHERIAAIMDHIQDTAPIMFVGMTVFGGAAIMISWLGPILAYPIAKRLGTTVDFDVVAGQVRVRTARACRTIPLDDVRALQVCSTSIGSAQRRVIAYELNLVFIEDDAIERACLLCGGPRSSIVTMARRIGTRIERPVVIA